jgi:hypothetical protein
MVIPEETQIIFFSFPAQSVGTSWEKIGAVFQIHYSSMYLAALWINSGHY